MNKTNFKMMLLAGLLALTGAAGFTACSDDDDKDGTNENSTEQKDAVSYNDLLWFQNSIVRVDSLGQFVSRNYGEPLYENDTTTVYIGVETLEEARKMFDGWMAPDVKGSSLTPTTTDVTATLTDKEGKAQGEVYFKVGTDGTTIAEVTTTAAVRHFRKVIFIPNIAWPHNVQQGKFIRGQAYKMSVRTTVKDATLLTTKKPVTEDLKMVCIRAQGNGVPPMLLSIGKKKVGNSSNSIFYPGYTDLISESDIETAFGILQQDWDLFANAFSDAGNGPLLKDEWYWVNRMTDRFFARYYYAWKLESKDNTTASTNFEGEWGSEAFYPIFCKTTDFYMKYDEISYVECSWDDTNKTVKSETKTKTGYYMLAGQTENFTEMEGKWYAVSGNASLNVLTVKGTGYHLILSDDSKLSVKHIQLPEGSELTIHGGPKGNGILYVDNTTPPENAGIKYTDAAGIGGLDNKSMGTLIIQGGNITVYGSDYAAGIGGGDAGHGGNIYVYGGTIKAYGGEDGAGIGGGEDGRGSNITIYGGKIEATARYRSGSVGAGIGGGQDAGGGIFTMYGGDVYAEGGVNAAGIGGGEDGESGNITIYGGIVRAYGGDNGAGIGSGMDASCNTLCFYGGDVEAHSGTDAAAIGTGCETRTGPNIYSGHIYFYGGRVYAVSDKGHGVAIGASERATCGWIYIYGGHVIAHGNQCGPWSGGFGVYCLEHGSSHRCEYDACGWNRITVGKCMRLETYSWNVGRTEYVSIDNNDWWRYTHERPHVAFEDCNHENGKYTVANCPWCHSFDMVLK
jgi:hypothetical protein